MNLSRPSGTPTACQRPAVDPLDLRKQFPRVLANLPDAMGFEAKSRCSIAANGSMRTGSHWRTLEFQRIHPSSLGDWFAHMVSIHSTQ